MCRFFITRFCLGITIISHLVSKQWGFDSFFIAFLNAVFQFPLFQWVNQMSQLKWAVTWSARLIEMLKRSLTWPPLKTHSFSAQCYVLRDRLYRLTSCNVEKFRSLSLELSNCWFQNQLKFWIILKVLVSLITTKKNTYHQRLSSKQNLRFDMQCSTDRTSVLINVNDCS